MNIGPAGKSTNSLQADILRLVTENHCSNFESRLILKTDPDNLSIIGAFKKTNHIQSTVIILGAIYQTHKFHHLRRVGGRVGIGTITIHELFH